jgi:hypothetical protein
VVHGSDAPETAAFEIAYFFNSFEIVNWEDERFALGALRFKSASLDERPCGTWGFMIRA